MPSKEKEEIMEIATRLILTLTDQEANTPSGVAALCYAYVSLCKALNITEDMQTYLVKTANESLRPPAN